MLVLYSYNMLRLTLPLLLVLAAPAAEVKLGEPLSAGEPIPIKTLLSSPASYVDKTVQVKGKDHRGLPDDGLLDDAPRWRRLGG